MKNLFFLKCFFKTKPKKLKIFLFSLTILIFSTSFSLGINAEDQFAIIKNKTINLEIAKTFEERQVGLMNRGYLDENKGMIFLFDHPQKVNFWMKNMKISLDMLFISHNKIVNIYTGVPPCITDQCPIYPSKYDIDSVLELKAGFCNQNNIKIGEDIQLSKKVQDAVIKLKKSNDY